jgi:hypothetical protein
VLQITTITTEDLKQTKGSGKQTEKREPKQRIKSKEDGNGRIVAKKNFGSSALRNGSKA